MVRRGLGRGHRHCNFTGAAFTTAAAAAAAFTASERLGRRSNSQNGHSNAQETSELIARHGILL
jgi:hypothetical protein